MNWDDKKGGCSKGEGVTLRFKQSKITRELFYRLTQAILTGI